MSTWEKGIKPGPQVSTSENEVGNDAHDENGLFTSKGFGQSKKLDWSTIDSGDWGDLDDLDTSPQEETLYRNKFYEWSSLVKINSFEKEHIYRNGFYTYVGTGYSWDLNAMLRKGLKEIESPTHRRVYLTGFADCIRSLDNVIDRNTAPEDFGVYRCVKWNYVEQQLGIKNPTNYSSQQLCDILNDKLSGAITPADKGYTSTSGVDNLNVFESYPIMFKITIKKGQNCFITDNITESEIILGRGSTFLFRRAYTDRGKIIFDMVYNGYEKPRIEF